VLFRDWPVSDRGARAEGRRKGRGKVRFVHSREERERRRKQPSRLGVALFPAGGPMKGRGRGVVDLLCREKRG